MHLIKNSDEWDYRKVPDIITGRARWNWNWSLHNHHLITNDPISNTKFSEYHGKKTINDFNKISLFTSFILLNWKKRELNEMCNSNAIKPKHKTRFIRMIDFYIWHVIAYQLHIQCFTMHWNIVSLRLDNFMRIATLFHCTLSNLFTFRLHVEVNCWWRYKENETKSIYKVKLYRRLSWATTCFDLYGLIIDLDRFVLVPLKATRRHFRC